MAEYKTMEDMLRGTERAYWQLVRAFEKYIKEQEARASSLPTTRNNERE